MKHLHLPRWPSAAGHMLVAAAALMVGLPTATCAQTASAYPTKPIRMVIPLAAGSAVDNAARVLTQKMAEGLGQPIVVENIAGSSGLIGAERVARAAPDGYTLGALTTACSR